MTLLFPALAILLGLLAGSFLNVVIYRGPAMWGLVDDDRRRGDFMAPRSYCPACGARIRIPHLVPVAGFLIARGRCAACGAPISLRYPAVELMGGAAALGAWFLFGASLAAVAAAVLLWMLIALAVIDLETGYLPDALTLPLALAGLAVNGLGAAFVDGQTALIGAVAGYAVFRAIAEAFYRLRGIEGLGLGDAKLLGALGAWLGWPALPPIVFIGALAGLIGALTMRLAGVRMTAQTPLPFGPALALAGAIVLAGMGLAAS